MVITEGIYVAEKGLDQTVLRVLSVLKIVRVVQVKNL